MPTFGALQAMDEIYLSEQQIGFSLQIHIVVNMTLVADRNLGRVMEMLTMKGKKQDDKEKGGGGRERKWPYETAVS